MQPDIIVSPLANQFYQSRKGAFSLQQLERSFVGSAIEEQYCGCKMQRFNLIFL